MLPSILALFSLLHLSLAAPTPPPPGPPQTQPQTLQARADGPPTVARVDAFFDKQDAFYLDGKAIVFDFRNNYQLATAFIPRVLENAHKPFDSPLSIMLTKEFQQEYDVISEAELGVEWLKVVTESLAKKVVRESRLVFVMGSTKDGVALTSKEIHDLPYPSAFAEDGFPIIAAGMRDEHVTEIVHLSDHAETQFDSVGTTHRRGIFKKTPPHLTEEEQMQLLRAAQKKNRVGAAKKGKKTAPGAPQGPEGPQGPGNPDTAGAKNSNKPAAKPKGNAFHAPVVAPPTVE